MLHGRDTQLRTIRDMIVRARTGRDASLVVCGEAGTGKTTLANLLPRALAGRLQSAGYQDWTDLDVDDVIAMVRTEASLDG